MCVCVWGVCEGHFQRAGGSYSSVVVAAVVTELRGRCGHLSPSASIMVETKGHQTGKGRPHLAPADEYGPVMDPQGCKMIALAGTKLR